jgi:choline dehydrogenase-like flavoprotein
MFLIGYGECLPVFENQVSLDRDKLDPSGLPVLRMDMKWSENELSMRKDMEASAVEMLQKTGFPDAANIPWDPVPGSCIHEMGTARMGNDPKTSVLNRFNQCHGAMNVFVTDGSGMVSTGCRIHHLPIWHSRRVHATMR